MNHERGERLGEPGEFELLEALGRCVRAQEASHADQDVAFAPMPHARREALLDRVLGPGLATETEDDPGDEVPGPPSPAVGPTEPTAIAVSTDEPAANDGGRAWVWLRYLAGAVAAAAMLVVSVPGSEPEPESGAHELAPAIPGRPAFGSVRIDGGSPLPAHQGDDDPEESRAVCLGRPLQLTLASTKGQRIDPATPLELVLEATPPHGSGHRLSFELGHDERFAWADDGRALVYEGPLERLAPLAPGPWTLQLRAGAPGACARQADRTGCTTLPVQTIHVLPTSACHDPR